MLSANEFIAPIAQALHSTRGRWFWGVLCVAAATQLVALALVCSHQVRKAEARRFEVQVQQMAVADCLQYIKGATFATCTAHGPVTTAPVRTTSAGGVLPVSFSR